MILQGTTQDGQIIPVQVDAQGRLVAEGLQGAAGPQGPAGPAGGSFALPADPVDGKVLGWMNGALAWVDAQKAEIAEVPPLASRGYVPMSSSSSPRIFNVLPKNADLDYGNDSITGGINNLFDGSTTTYAYWVGADYPGSGDVQELYIDLAVLHSSVFTDLAVLANGMDSAYGRYTVSTHAADYTQLSIQDISSAAPAWIVLPTTPAPRLLAFKDKGQATPRVQVHAIRINNVIVSLNRPYPDGSKAVPA